MEVSFFLFLLLLLLLLLFHSTHSTVSHTTQHNKLFCSYIRVPFAPFHLNDDNVLIAIEYGAVKFVFMHIAHCIFFFQFRLLAGVCKSFHFFVSLDTLYCLFICSAATAFFYLCIFQFENMNNQSRCNQ